jgi:NAD(P)-dependent dehydrogenase (short-subunit alcohol dehydrogenase family)
MAIALATGSSSGIRMATAVSLARRGHKVIATMKNLNRATDLRKILPMQLQRAISRARVSCHLISAGGCCGKRRMRK